MKISVITPTFNDASSIKETYNTLLTQTYTDWEWIVVNDGSEDDTDKVIEDITASDKTKAIIYKKQANADQLNALLNGLESATGEYIFILHSDDLLPENDFFEKCVNCMQTDPECDGLLGDLTLIDDNNNTIGTQTIKDYKIYQYIPALQLLWLGRNLFADVAFHKASVFKEAVRRNYLEWNMPFWMDENPSGIEMVNYKKVNFPLLKYRVHEGNYINNELGKLNVINGELRTAARLMQHYNIPFYSLQYLIFRVFNKLGLEYRPFYQKKSTVKKADVIEFIIKKRYSSTEEYLFLSAVYGFYRNNNSNIYEIGQIPEDLVIYKGKDIRLFNKKLLNNNLEEFYLNFMQNMKNGFSQIIVETPEDVKKVEDILRFFCIFGVEISVT